MTDEAETVRAWLTAQRAAIRKQILDLETYQEAIDWLLKMLPTSPPNSEASSETPGTPNNKREAVAAVLAAAPNGLTNAEARAEMEKLGMGISSGHMGAILSQMAAIGWARLNSKTRRYRLVS